MQIDFHHAVTYVIARLSGFDHEKADIISRCAQYVDDAVTGGTIKFKNGAMYTRISSAHTTLDSRNTENIANQNAWLPFHFLPGNGGKPAGEDPEGSFIQKIVCRPNSYVARDMLRACIRDQNHRYSLHRLGVTMHIFADSWAHQGFAGVRHKINDVRSIVEAGTPGSGIGSRVKNFLGVWLDRAASALVGEVLPVGHGAVLSHPDYPYLKWSYRDCGGALVERDNPPAFLEAANEMCKAMRRYQLNDPDAAVEGLGQANAEIIEANLRQFTNPNGDVRHQQWLEAIARGDCGFPAIRLTYSPRGPDSWKEQALGPLQPYDAYDYEFKPSFLTSNWKLFHDALQAHHFSITRNTLPSYGICVA